MNTPADAAWDPAGETYTIIGIGDSRKSVTIFLVDVSKPPGVFSFMIRHSAFSFIAL